MDTTLIDQLPQQPAAQPQQRPKRRVLIGAAIIVLALVGIALLMAFGRSVVQEIVQEAPAAAERAATHPAVGLRAPAFTLSDGKRDRSLAELLGGGGVAVVFWTTWNADAVEMLRTADRFIRTPEGERAPIVFVASQEDRSVVENFIRRGGYAVTVLYDDDGAVTEAYDARTLPSAFFIGRDGVIREVVVGPLNENELQEKIKSMRQ